MCERRVDGAQQILVFMHVHMHTVHLHKCRILTGEQFSRHIYVHVCVMQLCWRASEFDASGGVKSEIPCHKPRD